MKIAFYMDEGREQIVLTPETKFERSMLGKLHEGSRSLSVHRGSFYACQGGWTRHRELGSVGVYSDDESTLLVLDEARPPETQSGD